MDEMHWLFSHLCGQDRAFVVDGVALPVCERCLGLYAGALLTLGWLLATRRYRRELPQGAALAVQVGVLLAALLGGLHVIDIGPRWRLACGLWTDHVVMAWLLWASVQLRAAMPLPQAADRGATLEAFAAVAALGLLALAWPWVAPLGLWFWTGAAAAGVVAVAAALAIAAATVALTLHDGAARRQPDSG
jgi:hypothetical protein